MPDKPLPKAEDLRGAALVRCGFCGSKIARTSAFKGTWYGKSEFFCSSDCRVARAHELTVERDDESVG